MTSSGAAQSKIIERLRTRASLLRLGTPEAEWPGLAQEIAALTEQLSPNGDGPPGSPEVDQREPLRVITAKALCALPEPPEADELLGPLVVRGSRVVVGAHTGEGKTTLGLQLVKAVVTAEAFLDWTGTGGRALVADAEQGLRTIKRRCDERGLADCDAVDYLRAPDGLRLDSDARELAELEELLATGDYSLVFADPLYKLHAGDSNEERQAVDLMRRLDALRARHHFALILSVHLRKRQPQSGRFTIDDIFGSGAYLRGAEVVLGLQRVRPGYARLHFFKDRDGDLPVGEAWGLLFDREEGFRRDPQDEEPRQTAAARIRELLESDPGMTLDQLRSATDCAERTVRDALRSVGAVSSGRPKRWELPSDDQEELL